MHQVWRPASAFNFRDIGGVAATGGGRIRSGLLYRSATPQFLTRADADELVATLGVRLVLDLRFDDEVESEGSGHLDVLRRIHIPVVGAGGDTVGNAVLAIEQDVLGSHYVSYVEHNARAFVEVVDALASDDGTPALLHCAAGKDRTGVAVALLLSALGVPDESIIADYLRTADEMPALLRRLAATVTYGPALAIQDPDDPLATARPQTMRMFLDWLADTHGSATDLLLASGLDPDALRRVRTRFVDDAAA